MTKLITSFVPAAMRVRVTNRRLLRDLAAYLRSAGCIAEQASGETVEVFVPTAANAKQARAEVEAHLEAWRTRHEGVTAELVD